MTAPPAIFHRRESNVRSYCRSFPAVFTTAQGARVRAADGTEYLDLLCGAGSLNYGHNHPVLKQAVLKYLQEDGLVHGLDLHSAAKARFLETFERVILKPRGLDHRVQFTGPTGTNAIEAAFKVARLATGRRTIVSFTHGYHGLTLGSLSATANGFFRDAAGTALGEVAFMPYEGWLGPEVDSLGIFRRYLEDPSSGLDQPSAVVVETVQGEGGINVASPDWLQGLARLCAEAGALLIVDDIQAGCGRCGSFFSFERAGIRPDLVVLSKSIGAYGLPMSLVLIRPELDVWKPAQHTGTFRGNNLAFVAAEAALSQFWADPAFERGIRARATQVEQALDAIVAAWPESGLTRRGLGLMQGLVCAAPPLARSISTAAFSRGLIVECAGAHDEVLKLMPPLTIDAQTLAEALELLAAAVADAVTHGAAAEVAS